MKTSAVGCSAKELDKRVKLNNEVALTKEQADAPSDEEHLDDSVKFGNTGPANSGHLNSPRRVSSTSCI